MALSPAQRLVLFSGFNLGAFHLIGQRSALVRRTAAISALQTKLAAGTASATIWGAGDSTMNDSTDWFYLFAKWLGTQYPAYTVTHSPWSDALQAFVTPSQIQVGAAGDRYFTSASGKYLTTPTAAALNVAGDIDIRVKASTADWSNGGGNMTLAAKFGNAGQRGWRFQVQGDSQLYFDFTADGTNLISKLSGVGVPFADGATGWVRVTLDVDNGAAGNTARFYTSPDGGTWTQLGADQTTAGTTSIFASTNALQIGTRTTGAEPFLGNIFYFELRDGIAGVTVAICDLDALDSATPTAFTDELGNPWTVVGSPTLGGAPGLVVHNCSVAGTVLSYASDGSRFPKLTVGRAADLSFIDYGHNDTGSIAAAYQALIDLLVAKWASTGIVAVTQNPEFAPRTPTQIADQDSKMAEIRALAAAGGHGLIDAHLGFNNTRRAATLVQASDGVHPTTPDGYQLWAEVAKELFR